MLFGFIDFELDWLVKEMIDNSELSNSEGGEQAVVSFVEQNLIISIDRLPTGLLPGWFFWS
jgi:hypothetical protein